MNNAKRTRQLISGSLMLISLLLFSGISVVSAAPIDEGAVFQANPFPFDSTLLLVLQLLMVTCFALALAGFGSRSEPL